MRLAVRVVPLKIEPLPGLTGIRGVAAAAVSQCHLQLMALHLWLNTNGHLNTQTETNRNEIGSPGGRRPFQRPYMVRNAALHDAGTAGEIS